MVPGLHRVVPPAAKLADCHRTARTRTVWEKCTSGRGLPQLVPGHRTLSANGGSRTSVDLSRLLANSGYLDDEKRVLEHLGTLQKVERGIAAFSPRGLHRPEREQCERSADEWVHRQDPRTAAPPDSPHARVPHQAESSAQVPRQRLPMRPGPTISFDASNTGRSAQSTPTTGSTRSLLRQFGQIVQGSGSSAPIRRMEIPRARSTKREIDAESMSLWIVTIGLDSRVSATCVESLRLRLAGPGLQD